MPDIPLNPFEDFLAQLNALEPGDIGGNTPLIKSLADDDLEDEITPLLKSLVDEQVAANNAKLEPVLGKILSMMESQQAQIDELKGKGTGRKSVMTKSLGNEADGATFMAKALAMSDKNLLTSVEVASLEMIGFNPANAHPAIAAKINAFTGA